MSRIRSRLSYANVMSTIAVFVAVGTGGAYAANTIGSADIIDGEVKAVDIGVGQVTGSRIADKTIKTEDIADNRVASRNIRNGDVQADDLATGSVTSAEVLDESEEGGGLTGIDIQELHGDDDILDNTISGYDVGTNSIDADEVVDFGLTNQDVGVLFAEVDSDGTLANSSGGVTASKILGFAGNYDVDFGRDVSTCAAVATIGPSGPGASSGQINVADRAGIANAVFVATQNSAGEPADRPFRLIVVC